MIGVLHAYSRTNPGDGLLLDLTLERLKRVGVGTDDVLVAALDPDSFDDIARRRRVGVPGRGLSWGIVPAGGRSVAMMGSAATGRSLGALPKELGDCTALIGVGGGYLRSVDASSSGGTFLNHLPQLMTAAHADVPSLYLPQSIGPLRGPVGKLVARELRQLGTLCVRDKWSYADLSDLGNVRRLPDMVILDIAERWNEINAAGSDGEVGIVAGKVRHAPGYEAHLVGLAERLGDRSVWVVHKEGDRTKSDGVHLERLGLEPGGRLPEMLKQKRLSVVISVRLHAALMALEAGVPAIHLAYDRKGPSAFADLGLEDWCFDVRSLDQDKLTTALDALLADPEAYWDRIAKQVPHLQQASAELDELVQQAVA